MLAGVHHSDSVYQILWWHALEHITARARGKRTLDFNVAFKRCQHDDELQRIHS